MLRSVLSSVGVLRAPLGSFPRLLCSSNIGRKVTLPPFSTDTPPTVDNPCPEVSSGVKFSDISGLDSELVRRLDKLGFTTAFDIQAQTLPHTLNGRDLIGRALTGSGKTLAFAIPIINKLMSSTTTGGYNPRAIAIAPTRELCKQLMKHVSVLSDELKCVALYGGDPVSKQEMYLRHGADVVCATPGRLNDHIQRGNVVLDDVQFVILDEADELLTPNFRDQIEHVLCNTPNKQMMLFSATMPSNIRQLIQDHMTNPVNVDLTSSNLLIPSSITHQVMLVRRHIRDKVLVQLLKTREPKRAMVFTPTKIQASGVARFLIRNGIAATSLHSDLSQHVRESCLQDFRDGHFKVIVATDVAARGIDIPEVDLVVQYDPPPNGMDYYIHRSGRTGRKGNIGTSIMLLPDTEQSDSFLEHLKKSIDYEIIDPPSQEDMTKGAVDAAVKVVQEVDPRLINLTLSSAQDLYDEHGVKVLASALAYIAHLKVDEPASGYGRPLREDRMQYKKKNRSTVRVVEYGDDGYKDRIGEFRGRSDFRGRSNEFRRDFRGRDTFREFRGRDREFRGRNREFRGQDREFGGQDREFRGQDREFGGQDREFRGQGGEFDQEFRGQDREFDQEFRGQDREFRGHRGERGSFNRRRDYGRKPNEIFFDN